MCGLTLFCAGCGRGQTIATIGELPDCRICGPTLWKTADQPNDLKFPYLLTMRDRDFLRVNRIAPSED